MSDYIVTTLHYSLFQAVVEIPDGNGFAEIILALSVKSASNISHARCGNISTYIVTQSQPYITKAIDFGVGDVIARLLADERAGVSVPPHGSLKLFAGPITKCWREIVDGIEDGHTVGSAPAPTTEDSYQLLKFSVTLIDRPRGGFFTYTVGRGAFTKRCRDRSRYQPNDTDASFQCHLVVGPEPSLRGMIDGTVGAGGYASGRSKEAKYYSSFRAYGQMNITGIDAQG